MLSRQKKQSNNTTKSTPAPVFIIFSLKHLKFHFLKSEVIIFPYKLSPLLGSYTSVNCITVHPETQAKNLEAVPDSSFCYLSLHYTAAMLISLSCHFLINHQFYYPQSIKVSHSHCHHHRQAK